MLLAIHPMTTLPMPPAAGHTLAAMQQMARAEYLLAPIGIPEDPAGAPDIAGARAALTEAVRELQLARRAPDADKVRPQLDVAIAQVREGLDHLAAPGVVPPVKDVLGHLATGTDNARRALALLNGGGLQPHD